MGQWETKKLGQLCDIIAGQSPEGKYYNEEGIGLPFYQGKKEFQDKFIGLPQKWTTKITKKAFKGDILLSVRAPVGSINFATKTACIGRGLAAIRTKSEIDSDFLFYELLALKNKIKGSEGAVFASINKKQIESVKISYPPLSEQKRIVEILDEAFEGIDRAITNTEKNLVNAHELFNSYLNNIFDQKREDWVQTKLEELCEVKDGTHDSPKYQENGIPLITQKNIREHGLTFDNIKLISEIDHEKIKKRSNVAYGDILISMIGVNRGMSCIVDQTKPFSIKNVGLIKKSDKINQFFLLYYLKSKRAKRYVESVSCGGAQSFIGLKKLREFPILVTSKNEQEKIVKKLDKIYTETQRLEAIYQRKLEALQELKQSLLHKAFTGELTNPTVKEVAA